MTDSMEIVLILAIIFLPLLAQIYVSASFGKYNKVGNKKKITG